MSARPAAMVDSAGLDEAAPALPPHSTHDDPLLDCLAEIVRIHGEPWTAQALGAGLPLERNRLIPSLLPRAAAKARFTARWVRRGLADISPALLPAILLLRGGRACVLLEIRESGFLVAYPEASGSAVEVAAQDLADDYEGLVCFVRPRFRFEARTQRPEPAQGKHWFWSAVLENRGLYRDALVAALLINVFALSMPLFTMNVYDRVVPSKAEETLWVLVTGISLVLLFNFMLTVLRARVIDAASKRVDVRLSAWIMERVLDLRMADRPASVGAFAANLRSFETVRDFIASVTLTTLVDLPFTLLFLLVLAWISPWLAVPPAVAMLLVVGASLAAQARMKTMAEASFKASSQRNATLVEALAGLEAVKSLNAQGIMQRKWEQATGFIAHIGGKLRLLSTATVSFVQLVQQMVSVCVVTIGVYLMHDAAVSMGGVIAAAMVAGRCLAPLGQVAGLMLQYHNARASLGSIDAYMKLPAERPEGANFLARPTLQGAVELSNVTFAYPDASRPALRNVSLRIAPGEKVGIVGRIGSGKTTLEKLILALYAPDDGEVLLDGINARQIDPADLRRSIGYVPQDPVLFYGTLRDNIAMGAPYADDAAVLRAAALAGVAEFADRHSRGYDMLIGERGDSLSGGQRQAVAIARALAGDPPVLLLDEPSSNMDHSTETRLKQRLREACADKTLVLVTHRTGLLDLVDRVVVIENGRIVADGPKQEVIERLRLGLLPRET